MRQKTIDKISLLPIVLKIFEKVGHNQTETYLNQNIILYKFQLGFRQNYSTVIALSYLSNKLQCGFDKGIFTGMILIDLQKAIDTIDHEIFLKKLNCLDFSETTIAWSRSYLENRYFIANY